MKFKSVNSLNETHKQKVKRIIGVRNKQPRVFVQLQKDNKWRVLKSKNGAPINADKRLMQIATFSNLEDVLEYFKIENLAPYCPETDIIVDRSEIQSKDKVGNKRVLHKREQFRWNVTLNGKIINKRTREEYEVLLTDLSFKGAGFFTINYPRILKGDILNLKFTLNNKNLSRIEREIEVKHISVSHKKIGGVFVKPPRLDADLGFYLMFQVK